MLLLAGVAVADRTEGTEIALLRSEASRGSSGGRGSENTFSNAGPSRVSAMMSFSAR